MPAMHWADLRAFSAPACSDCSRACVCRSDSQLGLGDRHVALGRTSVLKPFGTGGLASPELLLATAGEATTVVRLLRLAGGPSWPAGASAVESDLIRARSTQEQVLQESTL